MKDSEIFRENKKLEFKTDASSNSFLYKNKAYKRNDSSTVEVNRIEYNRLILEGQNLDFEETPAKNQNLFFSFFEKNSRKFCQYRNALRIF